MRLYFNNRNITIAILIVYTDVYILYPFYLKSESASCERLGLQFLVRPEIAILRICANIRSGLIITVWRL